MKKLYKLILFFLITSIAFSQNAKSPYPIIFIHGITSDYTTWEEGNPSVKSYLLSEGLTFGGVVDVTLDFTRSTITLMNTIEEDVHLFPDGVVAGDFYFLNFAVHSTGYSTKNDINYPYPTNQTYQDMLNQGDLPVMTTPGEYHIGDIIRVENEFMLVNQISNDFLGVTRGILNSTAITHFSASRVYNLSNQSNQASIAKQGWGLYQAINLIKQKTGASKVIIVGHSMGGLSAREYIESSYYQNDIAKLVTIGTPHLGSKADEVNIWWIGNDKLDDRSDAMRDLRYNYDFDHHFGYDPIPPYGDFPDLGIYLFGGLETTQIDMFYSTDYNSNGQIDNTSLPGLSKNLSRLPSSIDYTWIVSKYGVLDGDIAVRLARQFPWDETSQQVGDTLMMHERHDKESEDLYSIIRGMDEPDEYQLAYNILQDIEYLGYMQYQTNYQGADFDYYRYVATSNGKLKMTIDGSTSGVNGIILLDQSGNLVNFQAIETFPFIYEKDVNAGIYYVGLTGNTPSNGALAPYTILPTLEPLIISLYNGSVTPPSGDVTTNFNFSVFYKNTNSFAPDNVQLHIINQFTENMTAGGSNWQQGVQFTKTLNNFAVGQYEYYFTAVVSGQTLRFPNVGNLNFSVTQNVAGWDLGVDIDGTYLQPSAIGPGTTITVNCDIQNFSNTGNTYIIVPLSVELRSPSGQLLDQNSTTIPSLASGVGQIYPLNLVCPGDAINGNYSIIITVSPMIDSNPINNSLTLNFYIGPSIGTELYESAESEIFLYIDDTFNVCGQTFKLAGVSGGNQATIQEPSGTLRTINEEHIRVFTSYNCAIAVASVGSNYASVRVLCAVTTGGPVYSNKEIIGYPGQQNIYFDVSAPASRTFLSTSSDYGDIFTTGTSTNLPRDWFDGINLYNSNQNVKIRFDIPSSASTGTYVFYQPTPYQGSTAPDHFTKIQIKIVAQPPAITSLSSYNFSADDEITIIGTAFGSSGNVKFNDLVATQRVSWSTTQIKVKVPVGVQSGNLFVSNSNGISNGMAYTIKSSTGAPVVISPIPDQSIYQGETKLIASLNNVFSEPNNQVLTFSVTSSNSDITVDQNLLSTGQLSLTALALATGTATITVTATDPDNKVASDEFLITIISTEQAFITLTSPNGGEDWIVGSPHNITWVSNGTSGNVKIEISRDNGVNWEELFNSILDDESESWTVIGPTTTLCKMKISDIDGNPFDVSDNTFNIIVQNVSPVLTWSNETGFEADGVNPETGTTNTNYKFRVKYSDADGDAPLNGYPRLHIKKSGVEIPNSPFTMNEVVMNGPEGKISNNERDGKQKSLKDNEKSKWNEDKVLLPDNPIADGYLEGVIYECSINTLVAGTDYTYYFEARDANNNIATGEATIEKTGPIVTELFTDLNLPNFPGTSNGDAIWGDYDNDGDLDILVTGAGVMSIYRNDGSETFNLVSIPSFKFFQVCSADWGDYDNDGDLDIVVAGYSFQFGFRSLIYKNIGNNSFTEIDAGLYHLAYGAVKWGDYDNDGDLDIVLTGWRDGFGYTRLYRNDGNDLFTLISNANIIFVAQSSCEWGDYDNDKDLDLLISGYYNWSGSGGNGPVTFIYKNDGGGNFTKMDAIVLTGGSNGSVEWGDYDRDGDLDILFTGSSKTRVYRNDGNNIFQDVTPASIPQLTDSDTDWGDYDNDGDLDFVISGWDGSSEITRLYRNDGNDNFVNVTEATFYNLSKSSVDWGDFDNDGDLDLLINGTASSISYSKVYRNNTTVINSNPATPDNLTVNIISSNEIEFNWSKVTNDETSQNGLTYNLVVGTTPGGNEVLSPMANRTNGIRRISDLGNTNHNNKWNIKDLEPGTYYWSVQAIDNCFKGSGFANEQSFIIQQANAVDFSLNLSISDNCTNTINLQLGTASNATDGFDVLYDQLAPPEPPAGSFDGRLRNASLDYFKDFRATNTNTTVVWTVIERPANSCLAVTISWDPTALPLDGFFSLVDGITGGSLANVDMRSTSSFTDNIGIGNLRVVYKFTRTLAASIINGWNMISLPLSMEDTHYQTLFPNATTGTLYGFNGSYYSTNLFESEKKGYWLNFAAPEVVTLEGMPIDNTSILLNTGWNLIGSLFCDVPLSSVIDPGGIITAGTLYGFNGAYYSASSISKGKAYWINANSPGTISFQCGDQMLPKALVQGGVQNSESYISGFSKIEIKDGNEITSTLYFSGKLEQNVNKDSYSLPPIAPAGVFDVRLNGGYKLVEEEEVLVKIQSNNYPVRITIDSNGKLSNTEGYIVKALSSGIEVSSEIVKDRQELVITDSRINMLTIKKGDLIPLEYSLEQNYPNPFNPSTTIKFGLPESARVRIAIYNVLGEQITELLDTDMEAGYHNVGFNALNLTSGVYLYRIESEKFNKVKKMIILK